MSNKTLVLVILGIIIVSGALAGYFYWQNTKPLRVTTNTTSEGYNQLQDSQQAAPSDQQQANDPPLTPATTTSPSTPPLVENTGECKTDFNANKLKQNSNMKISGRQAQIDVKGYGKVTLEFYDKDAPKAVENFLRLADSGYYDCITFHRIIKGFMIQGGDPTGTGAGGESAFGPTFVDELNPATTSYKTGYVKGVLAMANRGPNTNGSQFFIMLENNPLPNNYTIFGKVVSGQDVVDKVGSVATGPQDAPNTPVVMQSVKIIK